MPATAIVKRKMKEKANPIKPLTVEQVRASLSEDAKKFLRYVMGLKEYQPATLDDAADLLDYELSVEELTRICSNVQSEGGCTLIDPGLKVDLENELMEIELALPENFEGWLVELLGEGKVD